MLPESMLKKLDIFFAEKTIMDVNRETFVVCGLEDPRYKLDIALFFMKHWDGDYTECHQIAIPNKGAVMIFPSYWISTPRPLVKEYILGVLDNFYNTEVATWGLGYESDDGMSNGCPVCPYNE